MLELCYELRLPFVHWISANQVQFCCLYGSNVACVCFSYKI